MSCTSLFIGHTYIDVTLLADHWPTGDEKSVASDYAVSFGGNAVTAAFACAKLGSAPDLICSMAPDWLGHMYADMAAAHGVALHAPGAPVLAVLHHAQPRQARHRARPRCRLSERFPRLDISGYRALHLDGHQPDAALHYARAFRQAGILTSLDGGGVRENTDELLRYIDVAVCAERMCEQMGLSPQGLLEFLQARGCASAPSRWASAACSGMARTARSANWLHWVCRPSASWTLRARATCSTAPMSGRT